MSTFFGSACLTANLELFSCFFSIISIEGGFLLFLFCYSLVCVCVCVCSWNLSSDIRQGIYFCNPYFMSPSFILFFFSFFFLNTIREIWGTKHLKVKFFAVVFCCTIRGSHTATTAGSKTSRMFNLKEKIQHFIPSLFQQERDEEASKKKLITH